MRMPVTPRPSYRRRLAIGHGEFVRLTVFETQADFVAYVSPRTDVQVGPSTTAITLSEKREGVTDRGMVAEVVFTWRALVPRHIAHETAHAALAAFRARGLDVHEDRGAEEAFASLSDEIFDAIFSKTY